MFCFLTGRIQRFLFGEATLLIFQDDEKINDCFVLCILCLLCAFNSAGLLNMAMADMKRVFLCMYLYTFALRCRVANFANFLLWPGKSSWQKTAAPRSPLFAVQVPFWKCRGETGKKRIGAYIRTSISSILDQTSSF